MDARAGASVHIIDDTIGLARRIVDLLLGAELTNEERLYVIDIVRGSLSYHPVVTLPMLDLAKSLVELVSGVEGEGRAAALTVAKSLLDHALDRRERQPVTARG